ncbi:MAG: CbtA family protein [Natronomonas sp.]
MILGYLQRGVAAGGVAGVFYGLYLAIVGNPLIEYMEGLAHADHGHGDHGHSDHGHEAAAHGGHEHLVSETTTAVVSVGSGILWGILLGAAFGVCFYLFEPSLPGTDRLKPYVLAGAGFLTVSVTPWLVLPPAAPGAEQAFGTDLRLGIYAGLMLVGAVVSVATIAGYRRLESRGHHAVVAATLALLPVAVMVLVVPNVTPTFVAPGEAPVDLVAAFQGTVALSQAGLWGIVAGSYGWLHTRHGTSNSASETSKSTGTGV